MERECLKCKKIFSFKPYRIMTAKFCSNKCRTDYYSGENAWNYKGGCITNGYKVIRYNKKIWYEHDLIYFLKTGIRADRFHHIHHKDGDKLNNDFSNLEFLTLSKHNGIRIMSEETRRKKSIIMSNKILPRDKVSGRFLKRNIIH